MTSRMEEPSVAGAVPVALPVIPTAARSLRPGQVRVALRLEYLTVGWNVIEGVVALTAAVMAGSVALFGFGVESVVETASGAILIWRLWAERRDADVEAVEKTEHRAQKLVAVSLGLLAAYIGFDAGRSLLANERPQASPLGIAITAASLLIMGWLARAKRKAGRTLGSRALLADASQTQACFYLSGIILLGLVANAAFGWWWADPVAALGVIPFLASEARESWLGRDGC